jgi:hypothetical protein
MCFPKLFMGETKRSAASAALVALDPANPLVAGHRLRARHSSFGGLQP